MKKNKLKDRFDAPTLEEERELPAIRCDLCNEILDAERIFEVDGQINCESCARDFFEQELEAASVSENYARERKG